MDKNKYTAKTLYGLEEVLAKEIAELGASQIKLTNRAVNFYCDLKTLYRINISSRTALRILHPIKVFNAKNPEQLYKKSKEFNWSRIIGIKDTFAVDSVVNSEKFRHSKYASLKLKDAIVDQIREKKGERPNIDVENPNFLINLHIENDVCTISLDSSGDSLHKRGYRLSGQIAPLNEVLAAGMILISGWDRDSNFIDPMCGSGTLAIEAALIAANIPPNLQREYFGFMNWKSFDKELFKSVKSELITKRKNFRHNIIANDINTSAINSAEANAKRAKVDTLINFSNTDFFTLENSLDKGTIITNPPYGERLKPDDVLLLYGKIGDKLKKSYNGFGAWILSSNKEALKKIGLRTSRRLVLFNGSLECKFHNYQMYQGSKKKKYE